MFSATSSSRLSASESAGRQTSAYEKVLALRIQLQKLVDMGNQLPGQSVIAAAKAQSDEAIEGYHKLNLSLDASVRQLTSLLEAQVPGGAGSSAGSKSAPTWESVQAPQLLLRPHWEATLDKWNARLHFGSERKQSKLKVFNQKIWDQIRTALSDKQRAIEKSRMPLQDSARIGAAAEAAAAGGAVAAAAGNGGDGNSSDEEEEDDEQEDGRGSERDGKKRRIDYDLEVYDDRNFYSLLLKSFIQSAASGGSGGAGGGESMRADDLAALRKYRRSKVKVDRRASKGRKIRYVVHAKLQNFMFPVELPEAPVDVDRLYQSLFQ